VAYVEFPKYRIRLLISDYRGHCPGPADYQCCTSCEDCVAPLAAQDSWVPVISDELQLDRPILDDIFAVDFFLRNV
jgi:hypothetical protein